MVLQARNRLLIGKPGASRLVVCQFPGLSGSKLAPTKDPSILRIRSDNGCHPLDVVGLAGTNGALGANVGKDDQ